jgi:hypothetical protein
MELDYETRHYYHYFEKFPGSFALIARSESVERAIVFVHGFGGDALGTWAEFQLIIDDIALTGDAFSSTDLYFFQYESIWEHIESSADRLLKFLESLIPEPDASHFSFSNPLLVESGGGEASKICALPADRHYKDVVLAGHSEGGVVIREAIVSKLPPKSSPLLDCRLSLFAPAISGYAPSGILGTLAKSPVLGSIIEAVLWASPAYQDLTKQERNKDDFLTELRNKTQTAALISTKTALRANILWGRGDHIVAPKKYDCDEREFEEQNHTGICKPNRNYLRPLDWVK